MNTQHIPLLACPVCHTHFTQTANALICENAHSFDLAREGYVNLLRKKLPGDAKEMLVARRSFFEHDHYRPLSDALNTIVAQHLPTGPCNILDAGCGEGYYLGRLQTALTDLSRDTICLGIDISKEAVRMAAKRYKDAFFVVANLKERLVLMDNVLHLILNTFAPRNPDEFIRILAPGGFLLIAIPGPEHLQQLRNRLQLLNIEDQKQQHVQEQFADLFALVTTHTLRYDIHLDAQEIVQVVMMTPNYWHLSEATRQAMATLEELQTTIEFTILLFQHQ